MNQTTTMLSALRRALRAAGWTNSRLAKKFGASESTIKRWLAGKALNLQLFDELAGLCGLSLADLARETEQPAPGLSHELTLAQEQALSEDPFLSFLFMAILAGERWHDLERDYGVPHNIIGAALARLDKLALIDRLPGDRARALVDRTILWRKAPMRRLFETRMKEQFFRMDFGDPQTLYASEMVKLSAAGEAELAEMVERFRRDVQQLAKNDRHASQLPRQWYGMLLAARPLDMSGIQE